MMFNVGDKVTKDEVLRTSNPTGVIEKITSEYIVVKWDGIPGHWHYTEEQAKALEAINESC